jgi:NADH:ubiquinone oxidoreductase subunit E
MGKCKTAPNIMFDAEEMKYADPIKASKKMITKLKNESNN